jgi:hypothetical protein
MPKQEGVLSFFMYYIVFTGALYALLIAGSPSIFNEEFNDQFNTTVATNDTDEYGFKITEVPSYWDRLTFFFTVTSDYLWIHLFFILPMLVGLIWIVVSLIRGISPS